MKNKIFFLVFFFSVIVSVSFAQKMYTDYLKDGIMQYQSGDLSGALLNLKYVVDYKPKNSNYVVALFMSGEINMKLNKPQSAIAFFKKVIETSYEPAYLKGQENLYSYLSRQRQNSSVELSDIYYSIGKYDSALIYINLADTVYKTGEEDFNGVQETYTGHGIKIAKIYEKLGQDEKAIDRLLKAVFFRFTDPDESIKELVRILRKQYSVEQIKQITNHSVENLELFNKKRYCIDFLSRRIDLTYIICDFRESPCFDLKIREQKTKAIEVIKKTMFYSIISDLK